MNRKGTIIRRFSMVSLLVIFLLGVSISLGVSALIRGQVFNILAQVTAEYVQGLLHNQVKIDTISESHHTEISSLLRQGILGEKIKGAKIWDASGKIIFADQDAIIGRTFQLPDAVRKALAGEVLAEVMMLDREGSGGKERDRVLEVYAPMKNSRGEVIGAYEISWDIAPLDRSATRAYYAVWLMFLLGFMILYLSLYRIFKSASDTIDHQSKAIHTLRGRLDESMTKNESTQLGAIKALLTALDAKDNYTAGHSVRVADLALSTGRQLGLSADRLKLLEEAALFHDIGKIGVPEQILNKPGKLTVEEFQEVQKHPIIGAQIIGAINFLSDRALILRHHHERYDGTGYPDRLAGEQIPLEARILAVADTYDAITSHRPCHQAQPPARAIAILRECSGTQLDPLVVEAIISAIYPVEGRISA